MGKFKIKGSLLSLGVAMFVGGLFILPVFAQEQTDNARGSGLQISPTRFELVGQAGTTQDVVIDLKNVSGTNVIAKSVINDFTADDTTGAPKISTNTTESPASINKFVKGLSDVPLAKDETKKVKLSLEIPEGAVPGAYYGVIRYQAVPEAPAAQPQEVSLTASVGTILLVEVPGDITEGMQVQDVKLSGGKKFLGIYYQKPSEVSFNLKNTGKSFLKPFGVITVKKGTKELSSYEINNTDPKGNILPDSNRIFKDEVKNVGSFGKHSIVGNIGYGKSGSIASAAKSFWVIPLWLLILVIVTILAIVAVIVTVVIRKKKKRQHKKPRPTKTTSK